MIQRIQTVYIMLGTLLVPFNCFFVPFLKCEANCRPDIFIDSLYASVFCLLFIIVSIMTIFKFKNRTHQIYWLNGNLISIPFLFLILYIFHCFVSKDNISCCTFYWVFHIVMILVFFIFLLARRAIKKDDEEIKSINRLR